MWFEKFRHVLIGSGGECFTFAEFGIYFVVGFSNVNNVPGDKSIHLVVCLTIGSKPLPKRALHLVRSRISSAK